jgi:oligosaccharide repeat unit polymerase
MMVTAMLIFHNLSKLKKKIFKIPLIFYVFLLLILISVLRNNHPEISFPFNIFKIINWGLLIIALHQTINNYLHEKKMDFVKLFLWLLVVPLLGLIILNLIGYFIGLNNLSFENELGQAVMLASVGINVSRVNFPFSPGFNSYASLVGLLLTFSLYGLFFLKRYKKTFLLSFFLSIITILLVDTRSAFFYPLLILLPLFFHFKNSIRPRLIFLIPILMIVGSTIVLLALFYISQIPELSFLARNSNDLESGNARSFIWLISSLEFLNFEYIHLIGHGEFGHYISGASQKWAPLFVKWNDPKMVTPHSIFYMVLFDYGYIGLLIILALEYKLLIIIKRNWTKSRDICILLLSFFIYWNLLGITETFFGFYQRNIIMIFYVVCSLGVVIDFQNKKNKNV